MNQMLSCIATAISLLACSKALEQPPALPNYSVQQLFNERDSTVVLLNPDTLKPDCSAVSVYDHDGMAVLVTAAHCVQRKVDKFDPAPNAEKEAKVGDRLLYVTRDAWYHTGSDANRAKIKAIDQIRDWAVLEANQFEIPDPLPRAKQCYRCDSYNVHSVSAFYEWDRRSGVITKQTFSGIGSSFYEASLSIELGWSGSPVLNEYGEVVGVVTMCNTKWVQVDDHMVRKCVPGWSLFTSIP